jgi:hypothetical protein
MHPNLFYGAQQQYPHTQHILLHQPVDALWCCNMRAIASYNWCKIIYDNVREAGHKWKVAQHLGMDKLDVLGCSLFLMVQTRYKCNSFSHTFL